MVALAPAQEDHQDQADQDIQDDQEQAAVMVDNQADQEVVIEDLQ